MLRPLDAQARDHLLGGGILIAPVNKRVWWEDVFEWFIEEMPTATRRFVMEVLLEPEDLHGHNWRR